MVLEGRVSEIATPKSVQEAVERGVPLVMVQKVTGSEGILFALEMALTDVIKSVNVDTRLNIQPHQTRVIAETILENFKHESLEDFKLAFARGSAGFYGEIYRLDGAVITRWIQLYLEEKYAEIERQHAKTKSKLEVEAPLIDYAALIERRKKEMLTKEQTREADIERRRKEANEVLAGAPTEYTPPDAEKLKKYALDNQYIRENYDKEHRKLDTWKPKAEWLASLTPAPSSPQKEIK